MTSRWAAPDCPTPGHGTLLPWTGRDGRDYRCNNQEHDGRPKGHPDGESPQTKAWFSYSDLKDPD